VNAPTVLTTHAVVRARERVGFRPDLRAVIRLPSSLVRKLRRVSLPTVPLKGRRGIRYFATASLILVVRGPRVLTCLRLELDDLAEVLVDLLFRSPRWA
jgi:hypothetical protein